MWSDRPAKPEARNSPRPLKDEELVDRAQEGNQWATEELVKRYQRKAYAIAYHMTSQDAEEARDLTQEAFLKAFQSLKSFRKESSFYTWFYRIVVNTCLDTMRRRRRWNRLFSYFRHGEKGEAFSKEILEKEPEIKEENNPMMALRFKELTQQVRRTLSTLPDKQRIAFQFKVFHGMSVNEIAQVMGTAEGTVKSHLFRATQHLRKELAEWTDSERGVK
jgi:RNA polymerase sigma-70 factor (ECF subfamily)